MRVDIFLLFFIRFDCRIEIRLAEPFALRFDGFHPLGAELTKKVESARAELSARYS